MLVLMLLGINMKKLKSNIISKQLKTLIEAILENNNSEEIRGLFTRGLYQYFTNYCALTPREDKDEFFDKYFDNFIAERQLFSQIFLSDGIEGVETHTTEWRSSDLEFHEKIREGIKDYETSLLDFLDQKIEYYQLCLAESLLIDNGWKIDLETREIIAMGVCCEEILVADALLEKHGYGLDLKNYAIWGL